jgi:hypothetical protein
MSRQKEIFIYFKAVKDYTPLSLYPSSTFVHTAVHVDAGETTSLNCGHQQAYYLREPWWNDINRGTLKKLGDKPVPVD